MDCSWSCFYQILFFNVEIGSSESATAVFFCILIAYIVPVFHYITERTASVLAELRPQLPHEGPSIEQSMVYVRSRSWTLRTLLVGTGLWLAHLTLVFGSPVNAFCHHYPTQLAAGVNHRHDGDMDDNDICHHRGC